MTESIFLGCFLFGALFTALSAVLGLVGGHELGHGHPVGHQAGHPCHARADGGRLASAWHPWSYLNLSSAVAFVCWFGAAGYLATRYAGWGLGLALAAAFAVGLVGGFLVGAFFAVVRAGDTELHPEDFALEGMVARVTVSIPAEGVGEIVFSQAGAVRAEPARALNGQAIGSDAQVVVTGYERGVAQVATYEELLRGR
jgi:hypothetical protein